LHETVDAGGRVFRPPPGWRLIFPWSVDPRPWPLMVLFQVIADLFGIVDLVALTGLFNLFCMMRLPELQP
jgi:hypothetical protein